MRNLFLALAAFASMAFANWSGLSIEPEDTKVVDGKTFYLITAPHELAWFAEQVNSGNTDINAILTEDMMFGENGSTSSKASWIPIGADSSHIYQGTFDGAGHVINGLYFMTETTEGTLDLTFTGLFGVLGENAVVKNVKVENLGYNESYNGTARYFGSIAASTMDKLKIAVIRAKADLHIMVTIVQVPPSPN